MLLQYVFMFNNLKTILSLCLSHRKKGLCMLMSLRINHKSLRMIAKIIIASLLFFVTGCSVNPATGRQEFTPLLPPSKEKQVGAEQHRNVVNEFGGIYNHKRLNSYVQSIAYKVASASELPPSTFQVFILNSPEVNAFALPGGYVYLTRGLIAIANTEAELAGVIGHEMGHVTARHAANRSNAQAISGLGAMLIGVVTGSQQIAQVAQLGTQGLVASYSRGQEDEADMLGVRYLAKSGYNPYAQSDFLRNLRIYTDYEKSLSPESGNAMPSFFSTHPDTGGRVVKAREYAQQTGIKGGVIGRDTHLKNITGIAWGDDPSEGIIQGQTYIHPELRVAFSAPQSYRLINKPEAVYIQGQNGVLAKFDADFKASGQPPENYLRYEFAKNASLSAIQPVRTNGFNGVTALTVINTDNGQKNARLFAFKVTPTQYYRFIMTAPQQIFAQAENDFSYIVQSLQSVSASQVKKIKPYFIAVKKVNSSDTIQSVAQYIPDFNHKEALLRVINGLEPQENLPKLEQIKIISK
jgi:predicted Zn-dependent protease